ncbi:MAG: hypothetical protein JKX73_01785 [Flavobacteriales bacterium]|nr:hypothetical protein [Flavobacteriales bacterium]
MKFKSGAIIGLVYLFTLFGTSFTYAERHPLKEDKKPGGTESNVQLKTAGTDQLLAGCAEPNEKTFLEFNNVRALIHSGGDMFWDFGLGDPSYEVPIESGKHSMFLSSLWLGGTDVNGQLRIAAQRYRTDGVDFWTGPLDTSGTAEISPETCAEWDKHFVITRQEVDEFVGWFADNSSNPTYEIPKSITDWPAHGSKDGGESYYLAPFFDKNGDGFYSPEDGDYPFYDLSSDSECNRSRDREPKLFGDQTIWFIFNDKGNVHSETEGDAIGMEIHCQEFAFATNDEINNMTFTNYRIINRSTFTLINTYFGTNFDPDLGDHLDDYVGCDVERGLGYCYNGPAIDGSGAPHHYGENPPAIGVDFFEGPFQDPDNEDNPQDSACDAYINGSINGLNFGDGIEDNERWGMRRFVFYCNPSVGGGCIAAQGDPETAVDYYSYLRGYWKDGTRMRYGGNGHVNNCTSCEFADFMFPGAQSNPQQTDECNWGVCNDADGVNCGITPGDPIPWTEQSAANQPSDRRFVHSAGPFTLEPGAENDITIGVIWERATSTNPFQSVELVRLADDKAQALFDNCFRVLNGPDAPQVTCQELDQEIILYLSNPTTSNNYLESYEEVDPLIITPDSFPGQNLNSEVDNKYHFQGYQVYQLKDNTVSVSDLNNVELARLVAQVDLKDSVSKLVNFEFDESIGAEIPTLMVNGENKGISHSFRVTEDLFALGNKKLINHKKYYFLALAYSHNQYEIYTLNPSLPIGNGNKKPYLAGRKTGFGGSIQSTTCIPHKTDVEANGTMINSEYGDSPPIMRVEGQGNGGIVMDLAQSTIDEIMSGSPWKAKTLTYVEKKGPVSVKIIDPLQVKGGSYSLRFFYKSSDQITISNMPGNMPPPKTAGFSWFGLADDPNDILSVGDVIYVSGSTMNDGQYTIYNIKLDNTEPFWQILTEEWIPDNTVDGVINPFYHWALINSKGDTLEVSEQGIDTRSEQLIPSLGISITVEQVQHPGPAYAVPLDLTGISAGTGKAHPNEDAGFLEADITFDDPKQPWLTGVMDGDAPNALNWIKVGNAEDDYSNIDNDEVWESVISGTWAPGRVASNDSLGVAYNKFNNDRTSMKHLASIDLVLTADKSKWTRAAVMELEENPAYTRPLGSNTPKFNLRTGLSIDKNGTPVDTTGGTPTGSTNSNDAHYISATGMGWFPGYAINIETGERLNIIYGEDSWLINGNDMIWNPTSDLTNPLGAGSVEFGFGSIGCDPLTGGVCFPYWAGGRHTVYILGHNGDDTTNIVQGRGDIPAYDGGAYIREILDGNPNDEAKLAIFKDVMWVGTPLLTEGYVINNPTDIPTDVTIRLRVERPYGMWYSTPTDSTFTATQNGGHPMYNFNLDEYAVRTGVDTIAENQLALIKIVPNPYFAFSEYETSQIDHRVKITNLPVKCTVSIYNLNGTLIRQFNRDDATITSIDWDLKNHVSVPIASGVFLIHVNAPGIGERVIKWFGVLRPVDLDSF